MAVRENNEEIVKYLIDNNLVTVTKEITNYSRRIGKNNEITKLLLLNTIDADDGTMVFNNNNFVISLFLPIRRE